MEEVAMYLSNADNAGQDESDADGKVSEKEPQ